MAKRQFVFRLGNLLCGKFRVHTGSVVGLVQRSGVKWGRKKTEVGPEEVELRKPQVARSQRQIIATDKPAEG